MLRTSVMAVTGFTAHETSSAFNSEHLVIMTNVLVVLATLLLAFVTWRDAVKDRKDERRFLLRMARIFTKNNDANHRRDQ